MLSEVGKEVLSKKY